MEKIIIIDNISCLKFKPYSIKNITFLINSKFGYNDMMLGFP